MWTFWSFKPSSSYELDTTAVVDRATLIGIDWLIRILTDGQVPHHGVVQSFFVYPQQNRLLVAQVVVVQLQLLPDVVQDWVLRSLMLSRQELAWLPEIRLWLISGRFVREHSQRIFHGSVAGLLVRRPVIDLRWEVVQMFRRALDLENLRYILIDSTNEIIDVL